MKLTKLLLVEDDRNFTYMVKGGLEDLIGGYEILTANNGQEGYEIWKEKHPDIVVADIEMPIMSGYKMVEKIRETDPNTPIIFTSAKKSPKDVTQGYQLGANNYVKKPCMPEELHVHVQALLQLKSQTARRNESKLLKIGIFTLDAEHALLQYESGDIVRLTALEACVLQTLCENKGKIVKRDALLERHWNKKEKDFYTSRCLDTLLCKLRKKLSIDPHIIINVSKGIGVSLTD